MIIPSLTLSQALCKIFWTLPSRLGWLLRVYIHFILNYSISCFGPKVEWVCWIWSSTWKWRVDRDDWFTLEWQFRFLRQWLDHHTRSIRSHWLYHPNLGTAHDSVHAGPKWQEEAQLLGLHNLVSHSELDCSVGDDLDLGGGNHIAGYPRSRPSPWQHQGSFHPSKLGRGGLIFGIVASSLEHVQAFGKDHDHGDVPVRFPHLHILHRSHDLDHDRVRAPRHHQVSAISIHHATSVTSLLIHSGAFGMCSSMTLT